MAESVTVSALRLIIIRGATFSETITWKSDGVLVPLPLGTTAEVKVRPSLYDDDVLIRFATAPGAGPNDGLIVLTDPGLTTLSLTKPQTLALEPIVDAVFDILYQFPTGQAMLKLGNGTGLVDVREAVTRP